MFVLSYALDAVAVVAHMLISAYILVILAVCVLSWFNVSPYSHPAVRVLWQVTEPVFEFVRRKFPLARRFGGLDLSPLVVLIVLELVDLIVVRSLRQFAMTL